MGDGYYSAREAAERLGVQVSTIYAYVSRGLIRSEEAGEGRRARRYVVEDVEALVAQREVRRAPEQVVRQALDWGAPVLDSSISLIEGGRLLYRGHDAVEAAGSWVLERVVRLLWGSEEEGPVVPRAAPVAQVLDVMAGQEVLARAQAALAVAAQRDFEAFRQEREVVARVGWRVLSVLGWAVLGEPVGRPAWLDAQLAEAWCAGDGRSQALIRAMLILCADHELNVSTFAARCAASAGATVYASVGAGLCALGGRRHAGTTERISALFDEAQTPERLEEVVISRLRRGDAVPGFGHRLYPEGDPRAAMLLERLAQGWAGSEGARFALASEAIGVEVLGERAPTVDLALVACARALALPRHAPLSIFALGRAIGWIAHIIEQYEADQLIRPRARYVGARLAGQPSSSQ